jgi:hypothetical protein
LTARVHHVLTDGLLALERIDDIVKPALTINFVVPFLPLAVIINIVVVVPSTEAFFDLCKEAVENLVRECLDHVGLVVCASHPALHGDRAGVVLGTVSAYHSVINTSNVVRTITLNVRNCRVLFR